MTATGHLPKFVDEAYPVERDDLWAIPTAEVPLTSMHRGEILEESELPMRLLRDDAVLSPRGRRGRARTRAACCASTSSTRSSCSRTAPSDQAPSVPSPTSSRAPRAVLRGLGLQYRVLDLCVGDLGGPTARTFDLEVYAPGVDRWLEVSSVSWYRDYQARRANVRYRPTRRRRPGAGPHASTARSSAGRGSGAALVETWRQPDGSVRLPECLGPLLSAASRRSRPTAGRTLEPAGTSARRSGSRRRAPS